jgi:hypothetical protein
MSKEPPPFTFSEAKVNNIVHYYLAARCLKDRTHIIPLCEVNEVLTAVPFPVACNQCGDVQQFHGFPVELIECPEPIENLPDLPKFQSLRFLKLGDSFIDDSFLPRKK